MTADWAIWAALTGLTAWAAWTDARRCEIPNGLSLAATACSMGLLIGHLIPWSRLLWAAGTWILYELALALQPDSVGWGDVKWATIVMGWLGGRGLMVLAVGHLGSLAWATVRWWRQGRRPAWRRMGGPWAPGALLGLLILGALGWAAGPR